jgi:hypothetical protein
MTAMAAASYDGLRTNEPLVTQLSGTTITSAHSDAVTKARSRVALPVSTIWRAASRPHTLPRCVAKPTPNASKEIIEMDSAACISKVF